MLINLENASDVVKLLDIVNVFMTVRDGHKAELETYLDKIDELKRELADKAAMIDAHLCEINEQFIQLDDCKKEKQALATLNSALSEEIERIKTQQSCDKAYVVSGIAVDDLRAELKATIEENDRHKAKIDAKQIEIDRLKHTLENERKIFEQAAIYQRTEIAKLIETVSSLKQFQANLRAELHRATGKTNKQKIVIDDLRANLKAIIEENESLKEILEYYENVNNERPKQ